MTQLEARFLGSIADVAPEAWDRLATNCSPFFDWAFLNACETASAIPEHGILPQHATVWDGETLVAALPLYVKGDGRAEFIYDYAWYHFARQVGLDYYPKAVSMTPFTPVTSPHFMTDPAYDRRLLIRELTGVVEHWARANGLQGVHYLFLPEEEADALEDLGCLRRLTYQLKWSNADYGSWGDFLARFRHKARVKIKRELRRVTEQGITVETVRGDAITEADMDAMFAFYSRTCRLHGTGSDYLKRETWSLLFRDWRHRIVLFVARKDGERIAASFCAQKGDQLYGRYWGSNADYDCLYFDLAFYKPMAHAIEEGYQTFWVGFGNSYAKFARGLAPAETHSVHRFFDPSLAAAIGSHLELDREDVRERMNEHQRRCKLKPLPAQSESESNGE